MELAFLGGSHALLHLVDDSTADSISIYCTLMLVLHATHTVNIILEVLYLPLLLLEPFLQFAVVHLQVSLLFECLLALGAELLVLRGHGRELHLFLFVEVSFLADLQLQ